MKKHLSLLLILMAVFIGNNLYAQSGIAFGITPCGKLKIRAKGEKTDLLSHSYSFSHPMYRFSYERHISKNKDMMLEACYSKVDMADTTSIFHLNTNCFGLYGFYGYNFLARKRVQIPVYVGLGGCYYKGLNEAGFYIDFAARARLKVYLINRLAIFGGGTFYFGAGVNKTTERRYGIDFGILFNF
ncbi:MAG: hypothetical protein J6Y47_07145 [Bacteroidales bacterium]|nr:hypothetical protein [Bacteroidales bacterium]